MVGKKLIPYCCKTNKLIRAARPTAVALSLAGALRSIAAARGAGVLKRFLTALLRQKKLQELTGQLNYLKFFTWQLELSVSRGSIVSYYLFPGSRKLAF